MTKTKDTESLDKYNILQDKIAQYFYNYHRSLINNLLSKSKTITSDKEKIDCISTKLLSKDGKSVETIYENLSAIEKKAFNIKAVDILHIIRKHQNIYN